jgi:TPR repeat protein
MTDSDVSTWERDAANGDAVAMYRLGGHLRNTDPDAARRWWRLSADKGLREAMYALAISLDPYDLGSLWPHGRHGESQRLLERAAALGQVNAMYLLAWRTIQWDPWCLRTPTVRRDQVCQWLEQAAEGGVVAAIGTMSTVLRFHDPVASRQWLRRASESGDSVSSYWLAVSTGDASHFDVALEQGLPRELIPAAHIGSRGISHGSEEPPREPPLGAVRRWFWIVLGVTSNCVRLSRKAVARHRSA